MDEARFWELIGLLDLEKAGDDDAVMKPLVDRLATLDGADIFRFDDILAEKLHALDAEKYAREIGEGSYQGEGGEEEEDIAFSPDLFLCARCAAVVRGREAYARALAEPARMPKDEEFEPILYAGQMAYAAKNGGKPYPHVPKIDWETFANADGWPEE